MSEIHEAEPTPTNQQAGIDRIRELRSTVVSLGDRFRDGWSQIASSRLGDVFAIDLRSLALFRIFLGLLIIADIAGRVPNFQAHFTEEGVLPRDLLLTSMSEWRWSLFLVNSSVEFQKALFLIGWIAAVGIVLGYRTRLMLFIAWVIIMSMQVRNPMILSGADTLIRLTLF